MIIVSSQDLLERAPENAVYLPCPVDTELFKPLGLERARKALLIIKRGRSHMWGGIKPIVDELSRELGIPYDTWFMERKVIPCREMPRILNRYEYFTDLYQGFNENEWKLSF